MPSFFSIKFILKDALSNLTVGAETADWTPEMSLDREAEVDRKANALLDQHGSGAVYIALDRLNESIDDCDRRARDFWAQVVGAIHAHQRSAELSVLRGESAARLPPIRATQAAQA
jgi:hypothetical protein